MSPAPTVLVLGATGLLGRPVTRELVNAGLDVRALVRDRPRAERLLPAGCRPVAGNLRVATSLAAAVDGVDAVYLSLSNAMTATRPAWDPDADGTLAVLDAARRAGVAHLLRLSALGVEDEDSTWWVARAKREVDAALLASGLACTIFRPTWFMESIPLSSAGPLLMRLPGPDDPLYWIAGADFGRQVAAAIRGGRACRGIYQVQGPEGVSMREAFARFVRARPRRRLLVPFPRPMIRLLKRVAPPLAYVDELLDMTYRTVVEVPAEVRGHELHRPTITIEAFARDLRERRDWPRKSRRRP